MAIIKCPECKKEISNTAVNCPNCGCSMMKKENKVNQETAIPKSEIYKTAFIQSIIITIISIICWKSHWAVSRILRYSDNIAFKPFWVCLSHITKNPSYVAIIALIVIIILGVIQYKNARIIDKCKTIFVMWGSYAIISIMSFIIGEFLAWYIEFWPDWGFCLITFYVEKPVIISALIVVLIITVTLLIQKYTIKSQITLSKYTTIFIIYEIFLLLTIIIDILLYIDIGLWHTIDFYIIPIIFLPISLGMLWCRNRSKSKAIK